MPGVRFVIVVLNELFDEVTSTSLWLVWLSGLIQKPRWVIVAPVGFDILPVTNTELVVIVPLVNVRVGVLRGIIAM